MKVGILRENSLNYMLIAAMSDGEYVEIPTERVLCYRKSDRSRCDGVGVSIENLVIELQDFGEIHIAKRLDHRSPYDVIKKSDIVEIYTVKWNPEEPLVPAKSGLSKLLWRLSMI